MITITIAFLTGLALDFIWVNAVNQVRNHRPILAANCSVALYLCQMVATVLIMQHSIDGCVAYAAGSWVGTYSTVRWSHE